MRIAQIIRRMAFAEWGAAENSLWNLSKELIRHPQVKCEVLSTMALADVEGEVRDQLPIFRFPYRYSWLPLSAARKLALDQKDGDPEVPLLGEYLAVGNFDLFHLHSLGRIAETVRRTAYACHIPYLVTCRGAQFKYVDVTSSQGAPHRHRDHDSGGPMQDELLRKNQLVFEQAAAILSTDRQLVNLLKKRFPKNRIEYFPSGVDIRRFQSPPGVDFRTLYKIPDQRRILLSVGRIAHERNQKALLETLTILVRHGGNYQLVLIGSNNSNWYCRELIKMIRERKMQDYVTLIPGLPLNDSRFTAAYQAASLLLLPARYDATGSTVLEAWSAGVPVIAAPVGAAKALIQNQQNGFLISPQNLTEWVSCCEKLLDIRHTNELRNQVLRNAAQDVQQYSWENAGVRLNELYQSILSEQSGRH